jgi:hypothetical protein
MPRPKIRLPLNSLQIATLAIGLSVTALLTAVAAARMPQQVQGPFYPLHGKLLVGDRPAAGAEIKLLAVLSDGTAVTVGFATPGSDGSFEVFRLFGQPGVPAGHFAVTVNWHAPVVSGEDYVPGHNVVPVRYDSPARTPLRIEVSPQTNQLPPWSLPSRDCGG